MPHRIRRLSKVRKGWGSLLQMLQMLEGRSAGVLSDVFSPDESKLVPGSVDRTVTDLEYGDRISRANARGPF
jgi:hypothetical protein